jgi:hypothetical protein
VIVHSLAHPPPLPVAAGHTPTGGALPSILLGNRISTEIDTLLSEHQSCILL